MARACLVNSLAAVFAWFIFFGGSAPHAAAAESVKIFMLGDSLTAGYGVAVGSSLPKQLQAALRARGYRVRVINGGVSGDTSAGGRARLGWALKAKPHAVIVALGGNDALRGINPKTVSRNLDAILGHLGRERVPVLLAGLKAPRNLGAAYVSAFDAVFPALARKHGVLFYPFILEGVALKRGLNQRDGIHPNARGVARMVQGMLPLVERLILLTGRKAQSSGPSPAMGDSGDPTGPDGGRP